MGLGYGCEGGGPGPGPGMADAGESGMLELDPRFQRVLSCSHASQAHSQRRKSGADTCAASLMRDGLDCGCLSRGK